MKGITICLMNAKGTLNSTPFLLFYLMFSELVLPPPPKKKERKLVPWLVRPFLFIRHQCTHLSQRKYVVGDEPFMNLLTNRMINFRLP